MFKEDNILKNDEIIKYDNSSEIRFVVSNSELSTYIFNPPSTDVCKIHGEKCGNITFNKDGIIIAKFCSKCYNDLINNRTEDYVKLLKTVINELEDKKINNPQN